MRLTKVLGILAGVSALGFTPAKAADEIVIGFATAASGFMQAYDKPAQDAAMIRIDEINKAGGLLGKKIKAVLARRSRPFLPTPRPIRLKAPRPASRCSTRAPTS